MRQADAPLRIVKCTGKSAPLVVDQYKGYIIRMVLHCHRQNICQKKLALARTGHASHQPVRSLIFFVQIQRKKCSIRTNANRRGQRLHCPVLSPAFGGIEMLYATNAKHLQKRQHFRQCIACLFHANANIRQSAQARLHSCRFDCVKLEIVKRALRLLWIMHSMFSCCIQAKNLPAFFWKIVKRRQN